MLIQLEVNNIQDIELILNLARRLNIPFRQRANTQETLKEDVYLRETAEGSAYTPEVANEEERAKRIQRIMAFKATGPSSFGDALEWQKNERNERDLPFNKRK